MLMALLMSYNAESIYLGGYMHACMQYNATFTMLYRYTFICTVHTNIIYS